METKKLINQNFNKPKKLTKKLIKVNKKLAYEN